MGRNNACMEVKDLRYLGWNSQGYSYSKAESAASHIAKKLLFQRENYRTRNTIADLYLQLNHKTLYN